MLKIIITAGFLFFFLSSCGDSPRLEKCKEAYEQKDERTFRIYYRTLAADERQEIHRFVERINHNRALKAQRRARLDQEADALLSSNK